MQQARRSRSRPEGLGDARPGAVLALAGAVPLVVAVLLAAGLLGRAPRLAVGVGVLVLGLRVLALDGTTSGARLGGSTVVRGLGAAVVLLGGLLVAGGAAAAVQGGPAEVRVGAFSPALGGATTATLGALLVVLTVGLHRATSPGASRPAPGSGPTASAAALAAVGAALLVVGVVSDGLLGLAAGPRQTVLTAIAAAAATVAVRRPASPWGRTAGVASGLLLALGWNEAAGAVGVVAGNLLPTAQGEVPSGVLAVLLLLVAVTAAALLATAVRRRDALLGVPAVAVLLSARPVAELPERVAVLVVPVAVLVLAVAGARGRGPVPRAAVLAVATGAAVAGLVAWYGAFHLGAPASDVRPLVAEPTDAGTVRFGIATVVVLVGLAVAGRRASAAVRTVVATTVLLGLVALQPLLVLPGALPRTVLDDPAGVVALGLATLLLGAAVARARPAPVVLGALGLLGAAVPTVTGYAVLSSTAVDDVTVLVLATLGPALVALLVLGGVVLGGGARRVGGAQAAAAGLAYGLATATTATAGRLVGGLPGGGGPSSPVLDGVGAVVTVALLLAWVAGIALLAAGLGRRPSAPATAVVLVAVPAAAVATAAVAAAVAGGTTAGVGVFGIEALDALVGFRTVGGVLDLAPGGWPVLLGVLGATLVGAGAWLASRRPAPPDAPVGRAHGGAPVG